MVSVCIITYNHEKYIGECLKSILTQKTDFDVEIVIGEDGSTDNTRKIICQIEASYSDKINLLPDVGNLGMMPNFIRTLKACTHQYIAICEGDDYWIDPNKLKKQVDFMENHPDYSLCFTNNIFFYEQENRWEKVKNAYKDTLSFKDLLEKNWIATQTVMYRRQDDLKLTDGFQHLSVGDWPLHVLYAQYGKIRHLDDHTAVYRVHDTNVWQSQSSMHKLSRLTEATEFLYRNLQPRYKLLVKKKLIRSYYSLISQLLQQGEEEEASTYVDKLVRLPGARYTMEYIKILIKLYSKGTKREVRRD